MKRAVHVLAAAMVAATVLSGCDGDSADAWPDAGARSGAPDSGAPEAPGNAEEREAFDPPTQFARNGTRLQWPRTLTGRESYWPHLDTLAMHGDLAITYGQSEPGLHAFDMTKGEFRWQFPVKRATNSEGYRTLRIVNVDGQPTIFAVFQIETPAKGTTPSSESLRLYALNLRGEKLWQSEIPAGQGPQLSRYAEVVAADDEYVVVNSTIDPDSIGSTVVFSVRDREPVWYRDRFAASALHDGIVAGRERLDANGLRTSPLRGLRAADGSRAWEMRDGYSLLTVGDSAWLPAIRGDDWKSDFGLLETATGRVKEVPLRPDPEECSPKAACYSADWECHSDQQSITACLSGDSARVLVAFDHTVGKPLWQLPDPSTGRVAPKHIKTAWHGALYAELEDQGMILSLRTGHDQVTGIRELPIRVNERFGAFRVTNDEPGRTAEFRRAVG